MQRRPRGDRRHQPRFVCLHHRGAPDSPDQPAGATDGAERRHHVTSSLRTADRCGLCLVLSCVIDMFTPLCVPRRLPSGSVTKCLPELLCVICSVEVDEVSARCHRPHWGATTGQFGYGACALATGCRGHGDTRNDRSRDRYGSLALPVVMSVTECLGQQNTKSSSVMGASHLISSAIIPSKL